jgi:hypothetical protein
VCVQVFQAPMIARAAGRIGFLLAGFPVSA